MSIEADFHNFGRRVLKDENHILKPRPVGLEWLFLSKNSPLRKQLEQLEVFCIDNFVDLYFEDYSFEPTLDNSRLDLFELENKDLKLNRKELLSVGSIIGLTQWFGMGDLHSENIFIGHKNNRFICSPIDIECLFDDFKLPSQSLIIPSYLIEENESGLSKIFTALQGQKNTEVVATILFSYIDTHIKLSEKSLDIFKTIFNIISSDKICSRVILRSTQKYYDHISGKHELEMFPDEEFQTKNGDIPYFFRFLNSKDLYFWKNEKEFIKSNIKTTDLEKLDQQIPIINESYFKFKKDINHIKVGIAQIARYFDIDDKKNYTSEYLGVKINYIDNDIEIQTSQGNFKCSRK